MNLRYDWVYFVIGGFALGVLVRSYATFGFAFTAFTVLLTAAICGFYYARRSTELFLAALLLLGLTLGLVRFDIAALSRGDVVLDSVVGKEIKAEGIIVDEPDVRETHTKLTVHINGVGESETDGKVLIIADHFPEFSFGDRLLIEGELQKPKNFSSGGEEPFDYVSYLGKDDIFYQLFRPKLMLLSQNEGGSIKQTLFDLKSALVSNVSKVIPEPQASLLAGLTLGVKQSLGETLLSDFRRTGIIHIVVLSGYNVSIVVEFIKRVFSFMGGTVTSVGSVVMIALFVVMTGGSATAIRAGIMGGLVVLAHATGRRYMVTRALFLAGFLMVLVNPKILAFDASFQLSFMATLGLIQLAPRIEQYFGWVPTRFQLREFATATIATQLFVLPMILYKMGEISLVSFPVNMLVLPVIPVTMALGAATAFIGFLGPLVSMPLAWITTLLLSYQLWIVELFARLPFAALENVSFPMWAVLLFYTALLTWIFRIVFQERSS